MATKKVATKATTKATEVKEVKVEAPVVETPVAPVPEVPVEEPAVEAPAEVEEKEEAYVFKNSKERFKKKKVHAPDSSGVCFSGYYVYIQ